MLMKQEKLFTGIKNVDLMIIARLDDKDLVSVCRTSKRAKTICNDENFWRNRILVKYPEVGYEIFKQYKIIYSNYIWRWSTNGTTAQP